MIKLDKVKDEAVSEVIANIYLEDITPEFVEMFTKQMKRSKGKSRLHLRVCDRKTGVQVELFPKKLKVEASQALLDFFEENGILYRLKSSL